jgi:hypothetical protein
LLFANYLKEQGAIASDPFVLAFGQGMTEEKLLGGLDIKEFQEEGRLIYNLKYAFVEHEVVIFEELWDAFPNILLVLKDILQSRCVRMGSQVHPIKTKMVIVCTNRGREEVITDDSSAALFERFVFETVVNWETHKKEDYRQALIRANNGDRNSLITDVAEICSNVSKLGKVTVSPRTAGKAYKIASINGVEALKGLHGFSRTVNKFLRENASRQVIHDVESVYREIEAKIHTGLTEDEMMSYLCDSIEIEKKLAKVPTGDSLYGFKKKILGDNRALRDLLVQELKKKIGTPPSNGKMPDGTLVKKSWQYKIRMNAPAAACQVWRVKKRKENEQNSSSS